MITRVRRDRGRLARLAALVAIMASCAATGICYAQFELGERTLSYGSWGGDVFHLQQELSRLGYRIRVDGHFGKETERAVIAFQVASGLEPDGIVGEKTFAALAAARPFILYTVRPGDSLAEIARTYDATVSELVALNNLGERPLEPGEILQIPVRPTYTVRSGDTLSAIALRFGTTVRALVELNEIPNPDYIRAGAVLRIPRAGRATASAR